MGVVSKVTYRGNLRTECVHLQSGDTILTDAPVDNCGKGEAFSPTDLVATALASCAMTIIGILDSRLNLGLEGTEIEVTKKMNAAPRRIGEIDVVFKFPQKEYSQADKLRIQRAVDTCPVHLSLHPDVHQCFTFIWPNEK
mgnify:CR=1 FL=1